MNLKEKAEQPVSHTYESMINKLWDQYDEIVTHTRKQVEESEVSLLNAWEEAGNKLHEERSKMRTLAQDEAFLFPVNAAFDLTEKSNSIMEENLQNLVELHRKYRTAMWNFQDQFAKSAREGQHGYFRMVEENFRPFFGRNR